jgi:hypothetical protein
MALKRGGQIKGTGKPKGAKGQSYTKKDKKTRSKLNQKRLIEMSIKDASKLQLQRQLRQIQKLIEVEMQMRQLRYLHQI